MSRVQYRRSKSPVFRRERRWFSFGLAMLTLAYMAGRFAHGPFLIGYSGKFPVQIVIAAAGGMWLAGYLAYSILPNWRPADEPVSLRDVGTHAYVVPVVAFPVASLILGLVIGGLSLKVFTIGVAALFGNLMLLFDGWVGALSLAIPCVAGTCAWSSLFLYVLQPKYFAAPPGELKAG